jgi:hypothetical protein
LLGAKDAGELFLLLRDLGRNVLDAEALIATAYKSYRAPIPGSTVPTLSISSAATRVRRDSNPVISPAMQPPRDLTGLGLAHLGPMTATASNIHATATSSANHSPRSIPLTLESGSYSDITSEETPDETGLALDSLESANASDRISPMPYFSASIAAASAKLKSRSTSFIRLDDGSLSECLVSDMSNAVKMLASPTNNSSSSEAGQRRGSGFMSSSFAVASTMDASAQLSFKRRDIEVLRVKYRSEVMQQFIDMETARAKWKNDQLEKIKKSTVESPVYEESNEDADRSSGSVDESLDESGKKVFI